MAIIYCNSQAEVDAITEPKVLWINGSQLIVYTGADKEAISPSPKLEDLIARVKAEAQRRIFERYPQHKQGNMLAFVSTTHEKRLNGETLTAAEIATRQSIGEANVWILAVRTASNLIEADLVIDQSTPIESSTRWPA